MTTVNVTLSRDMIDFIEQQVSSGDYGSAGDVVRAALQRLQNDSVLEQEEFAVLKREIDIGLADVSAARFSQKTVREIADEVLNEFR